MNPHVPAVQGNFEEKEALELMQKVEDSFQFKPVPPEKRATSTVSERVLQLTTYWTELTLSSRRFGGPASTPLEFDLALHLPSQ